MLLIALFILSIAATASFLAWLFILLQPARPWDFQPVGDDEVIQNSKCRMQNEQGSADWPAVSIIVPARNEADSLPRTLPALLTQDYPGSYEVILVDDRSSDGTADVARRLAADAGRSARLRVITGAPLPDGWVGKVWALEQGFRSVTLSTQHSAPSTFFLLTDADIFHAPSSLRRLVSESAAGNLALNSRMARLRCESPAERLLIPAFVFFFNLLYPMRRVNEPRDAMAGAAGGCVLLSREAIEKIGGFACIRGELIDDVNLARNVKGAGLPIRLSLSRKDVLSLREYPKLADIWRMVRRSAFTELRYSWLRLAGALAGLGLMFAVPVVALCGGIAGVALAGDGATTVTALWACAKGLLSLCAMRAAYAPAIAFFELPRRYVWSLPLAGVLYGMMTLDSALQYARGGGVGWRDATPNLKP